MKRYYIDQSACFDSNTYDVQKIKQAVKTGGGKNVRISNKFEWANLPGVVTFSCETLDIENILNAVRITLETQWIIICEKDW